VTENGIERAEKAVETLVYGTVGLALYVRDTAPSFIKLFVARGKNELGQQGEKVVVDPLAQVKSFGDLAAQSAPQILRVVGDQVGRLRERAEDVIAGFGTPPGTPSTPPPYSPAPPAPGQSGSPPGSPSERQSSAPPPVPSAAAAAAAAAASATGTEHAEADDGPTSWRPAASPTASSSTPAAPASGTVSGLAITDYDELSASQVVDRLEGLPRHELEAIRDYERGHRARNTILGKIDQLTR
jgi:hypothetical protein